MNYRFWRQFHPDEIFLAKLIEEVGLAGRKFQERLIAAHSSNPSKRGIKKHTRELAEALEHVEYIARCWRRQVEAELSEDVKS